MAHFAHIDKNNIVTHVIVAEQDFIDSGAVGEPSEWVQTSYNTVLGKHTGGKQPLRKNFAGIGYTYDATRDAFIAQKKYASWVLNEETCDWEPPVPVPNDAMSKDYMWSEETVSWVEVPPERSIKSKRK